MTEFDNCGEFCFFCGCFDFLPFSCDDCSEKFCVKHRLPHIHHCGEPDSKSFYINEINNKQINAEENSSNTVICPLCDIMFVIHDGNDKNSIISNHIDKLQCPKLEVNKKHCQYFSGKGICKIPLDIIPFICSSCNLQTCSKHRYPEDHRCSSLLSQQSLNKKEQKLSKNQIRNRLIEHQSRNASVVNKKKKKEAPHITLMRLKRKAIGQQTIPKVSRFYLEVLFPLDSGIEPKYMFFNKIWTIGKLIDIIAKEGKIPNNNHKSNSDKLRIYDLNTDKPLDTTLSLLNLEKQNILKQGEAILLELESKIL